MLPRPRLSACLSPLCHDSECSGCDGGVHRCKVVPTERFDRRRSECRLAAAPEPRFRIRAAGLVSTCRRHGPVPLVEFAGLIDDCLAVEDEQPDTGVCGTEVGGLLVVERRAILDAVEGAPDNPRREIAALFGASDVVSTPV